MIAVRVLQHGVPVRETVHRSGAVRVGRGPENDLVLFDGSVSRAHAVIEVDEAGEIVVRDLGSRNGIHVGPRAVGELRAGRVVRCLVGRVELEIERLSPDDTLELLAQDRAGFEHRRTVADHLRYVGLAVAAWLGTQLLDPQLWSPWQQNRAGMLLGHALGALVAVPLVAFVLLGVLRLVGRRVRLADTLRALSVVMGVTLAVTLVSLVLYYAMHAGPYAALGGWTGSLLSIWSIVYLAGVRREGRMRWFRTAWAAFAVAIVVGMQVVGSLAQRRMGVPQVNHDVQPPVAGYAGPSHGLDRYLADLRQATAAAAAKAADVQSRHAAARERRAASGGP